jgi:Cys-tRNA(Pro)/Cys-tRNA(Cys) deacylase
MKKTNAERLLDAKSINYELVDYEIDESDLSATTLAKKIGEDIEQIFNSLMKPFTSCNNEKTTAMRHILSF